MNGFSVKVSPKKHYKWTKSGFISPGWSFGTSHNCIRNSQKRPSGRSLRLRRNGVVMWEKRWLRKSQSRLNSTFFNIYGAVSVPWPKGIFVALLSSHQNRVVRPSNNNQCLCQQTVKPRISRLKGSTFCAAACSRRKNCTPSQLLARLTRAKKSHCSCRNVKLCSSFMMMSSEELIPVACNSSDDVIWPGQVAGQGTYRSRLNCVPLRAVPSSPRIRAA